ncbi:hypothetical protein [Corynebacterium callunae]|uniref:hypothetical protein n=1 Tax=Corynebacterium callunae TaxID=1721 RepID=UPI0020004235|nr:hypothetical protein [Corynebacterium callunae]
MGDLMDLAEAVGVYQDNPNPQGPNMDIADSEQAAIERLKRAGERLTATTFGIVVGTGLIWTNMAGLW